MVKKENKIYVSLIFIKCTNPLRYVAVIFSEPRVQLLINSEKSLGKELSVVGVEVPTPLNIQPVVVVRGLKRQQALTNFVGCFILFLFSLLLLSALNDLVSHSAGPLA